MLKASPLRITVSFADGAPARRAHKGAQAPPLYENRLSKVGCSYFLERNGGVPRDSFYEGYSPSFAHGMYHV